MKNKLAFWSVFGVLGLFVTSCQSTSTGDPEKPSNHLAVKSRVAHNAEKYAGLSSQHKAAVDAGKVVHGMSKQAARLAWGKPSQTQQMANGREMWVYYRREQTTVDYHHRYDPLNYFGRRHHYGYPTSYTTSHLRPTQHLDRSITFAHGKVVAWTRDRH